MYLATFSTKRKRCPLVCYVCGDENPMDVLLEVLALSHSTSCPVYMMYPEKGYKHELNKSICLENAKINVDCIVPYVLYDSVGVLKTEWVTFNEYTLV